MFRKALILLAIATVAFAGTADLSMDSRAFSVGAEPGDGQTAHWQAYNEGGEDCAACVVDGGDSYSYGDKTWMYNSTAFDFTGIEQAGVAFEYTLASADANDFMAVYAVNYEPTSGSFDPDVETPLATYDADVGSWTTVELGMETMLGESSVYVVFYWESDNTGTDDGVRINSAGVWTWDGTYNWTNLLSWDEDHDAYGPGEAVNLDLSAIAGEWGVVEFYYYAPGWDWWAEVDQVVISDDTRADLLTEDFETWPPTDWTIENYGGDEVWLSNDTTGRTNYAGGDGFCAIADSDYAGAGTTMDTGLITPMLDFSGSTTVSLDFVASYNDIVVADVFEVNLGEVTWVPEIDDAFDDLSAWTAVDEGVYSEVTETSWGEIKTLD